jgi:4-hydroxythreonine-4-phosphate dehydrogenase
MSRQAEQQRPIGITMGCPASIGPELIVKYYLDPGRDRRLSLIVIGDRNVIEKIADLLGLAVDLRDWHPGDEVADGCLNVLSVSSLSRTSFTFGSPTRETSVCMASYVEKAIELCLAGEIRAMVTCPISKSSLNQAGYEFPGHTELLARRTASEDVAMMLTGESLRVVPATIHCSLSEAVKDLNSTTLVRQIVLTEQSLRTDFNLDPVRIAVAGLNPHAGENGLFGSEEQTIIKPAIEQARTFCAPRSQISGPHPPDTVFYKARTGLYDAVVAMYHDQGLIPFKLLHFDDGVNVTLGLPIVRTSVDHGTAYDIAGQGSAGTNSLKAAVRLADFMAANRLRHSRGKEMKKL